MFRAFKHILMRLLQYQSHNLFSMHLTQQRTIIYWLYPHGIKYKCKICSKICETKSPANYSYLNETSSWCMEKVFGLCPYLYLYKLYIQNTTSAKLLQFWKHTHIHYLPIMKATQTQTNKYSMVAVYPSTLLLNSIHNLATKCRWVYW